MRRKRALAQLLGAAAATGGWFSSAQAQTAEAYPNAIQAGWNGAEVCRVLQADERARLIECVFAPGVGHERHYHPPHVGFVIEGGVMEMTTAAGVTQLELETNSSWTSPGVVWHEALNISDHTIRYLMFEFVEPADPDPSVQASDDEDDSESADADEGGAPDAASSVDSGARALDHGPSNPSGTNGRE